MKKIFTFAFALMASVSLMAAEPALESSEWGADDFSTIIADHDGITLFTDATAWSGNFSGTQYIALGSACDLSNPQKYFGISATNAIDSVEIYWAPNGSDASNLVWVAWEDAANQLQQEVDYFGEGISYTGSKSLESAIWQKFDFSANEVHAIAFARQLKKVKKDGTQQSNFGLNKTVNILGVRVWVNGAAPSTDPVSQVTIAGPEEIFVNQKASYSATTDVKATEYKWFVNEVEQEGATAKSFEFTPDAEGTYNIVCKAKNAYNSDFVASNVIALVASARADVEQVDVTGAITWDWTKAATVNEIKWTDSTTPQKNQEVLLANVDGMNNNAEFNSQALLFSGEYPIRGGKYCQGGYLQFHTTVAGYVQVEFSNTGGGDRPNRYVAVNGVVNTTVGSATADKVTSAYIPVAAGDVKIEGSFDPYEGQYLRIYKVVFGVGDVPTAIENSEVEVKAVKVIRNCQMFIEKNGVLYNAQGAIVK